MDTNEALTSLYQALSSQVPHQTNGVPPVRVDLLDVDTHYEFNRDDILAALCNIGPISDVKLLPDGEALVYFSNVHSAQTAMSSLDGLRVPQLGILVLQFDSGKPIGRVNILPPTAIDSSSRRPPERSMGSPPPGSRFRGRSGGPAGPPRQVDKHVARLELIDCFGSEPQFGLTSRLLGDDNQNIHHILNEASNNVEIGIKGKATNNVPANERLHMTISSADHGCYRIAVDLAEDLLKSVLDSFVVNCRQDLVCIYIYILL
eukprot:GHVR01061509.1.p1 GENE.GHVR01061509.1~~GHVR01061509.1.p1  ORF type:complete len:261 (+),score=34.21 GHVR01061509.1:13-795(+)